MPANVMLNRFVAEAITITIPSVDRDPVRTVSLFLS